MELKEGMYVRAKDGTIDKIAKDENGVCSCPTSNCVYCEHHILATFIITKESYNVIDLIEVGDYVNGYKVRGTSVSTLLLDNFNMIKIEDYEIKSIVTKEQFESMQYEIN